MKNKLFKNTNAFLLTVLIVMLLVSCASKQTTLSNTKTIEATPKLIFLNYTIKKMPNGNRSISLINKITTDGKLKTQSSNRNKTAEVGDLNCNQLDKNSNLIQSEIIKNPLVKIIEYIDDSNSFQTKQIELDNAPISLRLQLKPDTKYITITDIIILNSNTEPLIKTQID